ncbi:MAG: two pore domain potassium channel family protein [Deltaproteobacteria bacterium]|nr:two pore domain potassium channel family protein [Deltaproteobacteria bacterium]
MRNVPLTIDRLPRYGTLLVAMLVEIVLAPLLMASGYLVARLAMAAVLGAALWAVGARRVTAALFLFALGALVISSFWTSPAAYTSELCIRILFVSYVTVRILLAVLARREVTLDTIAGAACVYMLLGLIWAAGFLLLEHHSPGSFEIPDGWRLSGSDIGPAMVYFSYVTLTTVGYGDIRVTGPAASGLVVVEAIVGQLFIAVTVARLVGLHISRRE